VSAVLILHRNPLEPFPFHRWLAGFDGDVVLLVAGDKLDAAGESRSVSGHGYAHVEVIERFTDDVLRERALALTRRFAFTHVIAHHEADQDVAAELRQRLRLAGPWTADMQPFRDKPLMKQLLERAGVPVAAHVLPVTAGQAREFAAHHGFLLVFKERAGFNAIGQALLRDESELEKYLAQVFAAGERNDLLLEAFVPGRMCHVDGLVVDGRTVLAWPSQYQYDLASFASDAGARVDLTLDVDDPLTPRLLDLTEAALAALRPADGGRLRDYGFHAEIFHTPDDRLVVCEVAARPGGAKIREVLEVLFGVNHGEYATRAQLGLPLGNGTFGIGSSGNGELPRPRSMAGQLLFMKRPGRVVSLPHAPHEPWVHRFWLYARPGQVIPPASGSSDFLACVVGSARTRAECERRLRELGARFEAETEISLEIDEMRSQLIDKGA
jgi:hypothetical protein